MENTAALTTNGIELANSPSNISFESDMGLIEAMKRGEERAFNELFKRYRQRLFRLSLLHTGEEDAARDCVQEAFISLLRYINNVRQVDSIYPLLAKITINACLQIKREATRRENREAAIAIEEAGTESPENALSASELGRIMMKTIEALPPKQKACVLLRLETDMTVSEIAKAAGVSNLAARLQIHRGLKRLEETAKHYQKGEKNER